MSESDHEPRGCSIMTAPVQIPFEPVLYLGYVSYNKASKTEPLPVSECIGIEMWSLAIMHTIKFERKSRTRMVS